MSNLATIVNNILADSGIDDINVVVTNGSYSNPAWITALSWSKITSTPTTLSGYGITDAVPSSRTLTINGVSYDLSANRSWNIVSDVTSVNAGTGISVNQTTGSVTVTNTGVLSVNGGTGAITGIATTAQLANYLLLAGGTMTGNINWGQTDRGITWAFNTDGAYIKFYNTGDGDTDSRLEFATQDNNNEYFRWGHVPSGGSFYESMRLVPNASGSAELIVIGKIIKSGGTSSQFLKANGDVDSTSYQPSITLTTTGTSGAATLVGATLNIPQYQSVLTNPVTGTGSSGQVAYWSSSSAITGESNLFWDASNDRLGIGINAPIYSLDVRNSVNAEPYVQAQFKSDGAANIGGLLVAGTAQAHVRFLVGSSTWGGAGAKQWQVRVGNGSGQDSFSVYSWTIGDNVMSMNGATGNVGINGDPDASSKLVIKSTNIHPNVLRLENNNTTANEAGIRMRAINPDGTAYAHADIGVYSTGSDTGNFFIKFPYSNDKQTNVRLALNSAGNLMLGTTTATLGYSRISLVGGEPSGTGPNTGIQFTYNASTFGGGAITTINAAGGGLSFYNFTGNVGSETYSQVMTLFSTGNLLVQTGGARTDAGYKLDVVGTSRTRGLVIDGANNANVAKLNWTRTDQSWSINNETNLRFYTGSGNTLSPSTQVLEIATSGASTFSSSVSASSFSSVSAQFNPYSSAGTVSVPVFQDAILLGPSANASKIQFGNEFQSTHGSYIRFQVNSASSQNAPTTALTLFPSGAATFSSSVTSTGLIVNGTEIYMAPANYSSGGFSRLLGRNASTGRIEGMSAADIQAFVGIGNYLPLTGGTLTGTLTISGLGYGDSLVISTSSANGADIRLTNTSAGGKIYNITSTGVNNALGAGGLQFYNETNGVVAFGYTAARNFLINTSSDNGSRLRVNGTGWFDSGVTANGASAINGTLTVSAGTTAEFAFGVNSDSTFAFGSTNGRRGAIIAHSTIGDSGLQFGWDTVDKTGIIAGSANVTGAGIDFYTYNGSSWGNRVRIPLGGGLESLGAFYTGGTRSGSMSNIYSSTNNIYYSQSSASAIQVAGTNTVGNGSIVITNTGGTGAYSIIGNAGIASGYGLFIQSQDRTVAQYYPLLLQPNGGNVGIGATTLNTKLTVSNVSVQPAAGAIQGDSKFLISGVDGNMDLLSQDDNTTVSNSIGMGRYNATTGALIHKFGIVSWANTGSAGSNSGSRLGFHYGTNQNAWDSTELVSMLATGRVGINDTNPTSLLTITGGNGGNDPYVQLRINGQGAYPSNIAGIALNNSGVQQHIRFLKNGVERFQMRYNEGVNEDNKFKFYSFITGSDFATFNANNDNVGFGTTNPLGIINNKGVQIARGGHTTLMIGDGTSNGGVLQSSDSTRRMFMGANIYDDESNSWSQFTGTAGYAAFDAIGGDSNGLARILVGSPADSGYGGGNIFFEAYKDNASSYIRMRTNTGNALFISDAGRTILGSESDNGYKLQVVNGNTWSNGVRIGRDFSIDNRATVRLDSNGDFPADILFGRTPGALETSWTGVYWSISSRGSGEGNEFRIYRGVANTGGSEIQALRITPSAGAAIFINTVTATGFFESSDSRIKNLIQDTLDYQAIANVTAKYYEKNGKIELGYFAQDFETLLPNAVSKNEDGYLNLSYREVHTAKIAYLEKRITELEKQLKNK